MCRGTPEKCARCTVFSSAFGRCWRDQEPDSCTAYAERDATAGGFFVAPADIPSRCKGCFRYSSIAPGTCAVNQEPLTCTEFYPTPKTDTEFMWAMMSDEEKADLIKLCGSTATEGDTGEKGSL